MSDELDKFQHLEDDVPTQEPSEQATEDTLSNDESLHISATTSEDTLNTQFNENFSQAQSYYAETVYSLNDNENQLSLDAGDTRQEIDNLKGHYADVLPKEFLPSKKDDLNAVIANTKTGKYPKEIQSALEEELGLNKNPEDPNKKPGEDDDRQRPRSRSGGGGGSLFSSLKKSYKSRKKPLTDSIIQNNNMARKQIADMAEASALCKATQGALKSHLKSQNYDTEKAIADLKHGQATPESQQLMNDPVAQKLIHDNDIAMRNAMIVLNPEQLRNVDATLESGLIDPDMKEQFGNSLKGAIESIEENEKLPSNDETSMEKVAEAMKNFIDSIKGMFGIKPSLDSAASSGMGR